jgi:hypothetical protein
VLLRCTRSCLALLRLDSIVMGLGRSTQPIVCLLCDAQAKQSIERVTSAAVDSVSALYAAKEKEINTV